MESPSSAAGWARQLFLTYTIVRFLEPFHEANIYVTKYLHFFFFFYNFTSKSDNYASKTICLL